MLENQIIHNYFIQWENLNCQFFRVFVLGRSLILAFNKKCAKIIDSATYILRRIVIG